jgi:hypothetical protein
MNRRSLALIWCWLAVALVTGGAEGLDRAASEDLKGRPITENMAAHPTLTDWPTCVPSRTSNSDFALCDTSSGRIYSAAFRAIRNRLAIGKLGPHDLCQIDLAVVRAQRCISQPGNADLVAGLIGMLAHNWEQQANNERAAQLYSAAYSILEGGGSIMAKIGLLRDWSNFILASGDNRRAVELAKLATAFAREDLQTADPKEFSIVQLIDTLNFEATTLKTVGLDKEAREIQEEADKLAAQLPPCEGLCYENTRKIK